MVTKLLVLIKNSDTVFSSHSMKTVLVDGTPARYQNTLVSLFPANYC